MKKRYGFVSNSSSASYVLEIGLKECDFLELFSVTKAQIVDSGHDIYENVFGRVEISGYTTMWNGEEDMGELLLAIMKEMKVRGIAYRVNVSE